MAPHGRHRHNKHVVAQFGYSFRIQALEYSLTFASHLALSRTVYAVLMNQQWEWYKSRMAERALTPHPR